MAIVVSCTCGRKLQIKDEFAGKQGKCPGCERLFQIPAAATETEAIRAARAEPIPAPEPESVVQRLPEQKQAESAQPVTNHGGEALHPDLDFFADPPEAIGPLVSAYSTLRHGMKPWTAAGRLGLGGGIGLAAALFGFFIVAAADPRGAVWWVFWPAVSGLMGGIIGVLCTGFTHKCTYVGRDGVARYTCTGNRDNVSGEEIFLFRNAAELRTAQTRHYYNGAYTGTSYTYTWSDVGGRKRYVITGQHKSEKGNPPSTDPYQFGRAAELQWTTYLLGETFRAIDLRGSVLFNVTGGKWIRLGPGFIIISTGKNDDGEQWDRDEIGAIQVDQGIVRIKRADAKEGWFSSEGVFKFNFDSLANAQLFFHLCDKVVGVPVG